MIVLLILAVVCAFVFGWFMCAVAAMGKQADEIIQRQSSGGRPPVTSAGVGVDLSRTDRRSTR